MGASEGGLITALSVEQSPNVFSAGVAACGPVGDFPLQINYFGDARATFEYFFPGLIPGDPLRSRPGSWPTCFDYYETAIKPVVFDPATAISSISGSRRRTCRSTPDNYLVTVEQSVRDALRYSRRQYQGCGDDARRVSVRQSHPLVQRARTTTSC